MDKAKLIDKLNQAIGFELAGLLQYNQYGQVISGRDRRVWREYFIDQADESLAHARRFAQRVVALGGKPCVEPETVIQTTNLTEMLENSLAVEKKLVELYTEALEIASDSPAYRTLLEEQIFAETEDVDELMLYLDRVQAVGESASPAAKSKSA